ncbi:MAG: recombination regulator RecX [Actinomycetota bacterium]|nr:recombination regulator RecX [Actinomycetota bacterium]
MGPVQEAMPGLTHYVGRDAAPAALLEGARREAMARAGRLLATRPRTEKELGDRLTDAGFESEVVDAVLDRLRTLGLVDDGAFAVQWVSERSARKKLSRRALLHELRGKGVAPDVAEAALAEAGVDEEAQAVDLAARYVRRVASKPLPEQFTRIRQMLTRRGYGFDVAEAAARAVLPPEGWD